MGGTPVSSRTQWLKNRGPWGTLGLKTRSKEINLPYAIVQPVQTNIFFDIEIFFSCFRPGLPRKFLDGPQQPGEQALPCPPTLPPRG